MADGSPVNEGQCNERRGEMYERITTLEKEVAAMQGAHKLAVVISPIIASIILMIGGVAFAYYIKYQVQTLKLELKSEKKIKTTETSWLLSKYP